MARTSIASHVPRDVWRHRIALSDEEAEDISRRWGLRILGVAGQVLEEDFGTDDELDIVVAFHEGRGYDLLDLGALQSEISERLGPHAWVIDLDSLSSPTNPHRDDEFAARVRGSLQSLHALDR